MINTTGIWEQKGNIENTSQSGKCFLHFSSVWNVWSVLTQRNTGLRLLHLIYDIYLNLLAQNNKTRSSYVLYSDKIWLFDQSEPRRILSTFQIRYIKNEAAVKSHYIYIWGIWRQVEKFNLLLHQNFFSANYFSNRL